MERTFLGSGILPALTDTVPAGNSGAFRILYRIILRQVPTLDDIAKVLNIGVAGSITTILDDLCRFLVIGTACQTLIAFPAATHRSEQICCMVGNGVFHTGVLAEVSSDRHIAAIGILLLRFLRIDRLAIPTAAAPAVPGKRGLHAEAVIGILCQLRFTVAGFQNELCHRHAGKDASGFLVRSKQRANLCHCLCFREIFQRRSLHAR